MPGLPHFGSTWASVRADVSDPILIPRRRVCTDALRSKFAALFFALFMSYRLVRRFVCIGRCFGSLSALPPLSMPGRNVISECAATVCFVGRGREAQSDFRLGRALRTLLARLASCRHFSSSGIGKLLGRCFRAHVLLMGRKRCWAWPRQKFH